MPESTVHRILSAVETMATDACGAFVVDIDEDNVASVFVERNQVCWAAYVGMHRRLRNLLREHLAHAHVKSDAMREALRQHTIESLLRMPQQQGERVSWIAHRHAGYQPRFTFTPAELLVAANSLLYQTEAAGAELALAIVDHEVRAASYVPADDGGLVAVRTTGGRTTIAELDELGAWAEAAFSVTRGFSREVMNRAVQAATGEMCIAWQTSRVHTHAAVVEPGRGLERLIKTIEGRNYPAVLSRRASSSSLAVRGGLGTVDSNA